MNTTKTYETPAMELIEALNEGFIAASGLIGSGAGDDLPVEEWGDAFQSL